MKTEVWLPIKGYAGVYEISSLGRVKSVAREIKDGRTKGTRKRKEIISEIKCGENYTASALRKNGVRKNYLRHRLVAEAFIPNPENKSHVNHINGIKGDNRVENLEWCTASENSQHGFDLGLNKPYWLGKKRSEETRAKISKNQTGRVSPRKGVRLSEETKQKISNTLKGNIPWNKRL